MFPKFKSVSVYKCLICLTFLLCSPELSLGSSKRTASGLKVQALNSSEKNHLRIRIKAYLASKRKESPKSVTITRSMNSSKRTLISGALKHNKSIIDTIDITSLTPGTHKITYYACAKKNNKTKKTCLPKVIYKFQKQELPPSLPPGGIGTPTPPSHVTPTPSGELLATNLVISSSINPTYEGQLTTLVAAVAPVKSSRTSPSGFVTFKINNNMTKTVTIYDGIAKLALNELEAGAYLVKASYAGDASFASSLSNEYSQIVTKEYEKSAAPSGSLDVTKYGLVGDGITDNADALQSMIDSIPNGTSFPGQGTIGVTFYFPEGTYQVGRMIDFSRLNGYSLLGEVDGLGKPVSFIKSTTPDSVTVRLSSATSKAFQIESMGFIASTSGGIAVQVLDSVNATFDNCNFTGHVGLDFGAFSGAVRSSRFIGAPGSNIGLISHLATENFVENSEFRGWNEGIRSSGTGLSVIRSRFENNRIGARLGVLRDGGSWYQARSSWRDLYFAHNDIGLSLDNVGSSVFANITIIGSDKAPSGQSQTGIHSKALSRATLVGIDVSGAFTSSAVHSRANIGFSNNSMYGSNIRNALAPEKAHVWLFDYAGSSVDRQVACPENSTCTTKGEPYFRSIPNACSHGTIKVLSSIFYSSTKSNNCYSYVASQCDGKTNCVVSYSPTNCGGNLGSETLYGQTTFSCIGGAQNELVSGIQNNYFSSNSPPHFPVEADDVIGDEVVSGPKSLVIDVKEHGAVGDGKFDNSALLQELIDNAAPGSTFYFPTGAYYVKRTLDFSKLSRFSILGDSKSLGGNGNGSTIVGRNILGPVINVDYGSSAGSFHIRKINIFGETRTAGVGIYARNAVLSSISKIQIQAVQSIVLDNPFKVALRSTQLDGSYGLVVNGGYGSTLEVGNFNANSKESVRLGSTTNFSIYASRFEVIPTAMNIGMDQNGNKATNYGTSIEGITAEANDYHLVLNSCDKCWIAAVGTQGSTNAQAGLSINGMIVNEVKDSTFTSVGMGGAYSNHAIKVLPKTSNSLFSGCSASNGGSGQLWDIQSSDNLMFFGSNNN